MNVDHRVALEIGKLTLEKCQAEAVLEQYKAIVQELVTKQDDYEALRKQLTELSSRGKHE